MIKEIEFTRSGDIWADVDETTWNTIRFNGFELIEIELNHKNLYKLLPELDYYLSSIEQGNDPFEEIYAVKSMEQDFESIHRVVLRYLDRHTKPFETLRQVYLYVYNIELKYNGSYKHDGINNQRVVEMGDDNWWDYYTLVLNTTTQKPGTF